MPGRTIAIGDIHGCDEALYALLEAVAPVKDDLIILLGDYIDRGPNSRGVVDKVLYLYEDCNVMPLLGNHEVMLLAELDGQSPNTRLWLQYGGMETLGSYGGNLACVPDVHREFFRSCQRYFETETHFFLHARYLPEFPLEEQPDEHLLWRSLLPYPPEPHCSGKTAIVGHTAQSSGEILDLGYLKCIDTYCYGGGWLTALDVDTGEVWQADREGRLRIR